MLNVGTIQEGFVLDHIQAGKCMDIYKYLHLDQLDCCVAIIKNARSNKMGKKDIIKIECPIDFIDMKFEESKETVLKEIMKNSKKDRSRVQVEEFTKLNLMEITRKHINSKKDD